MSAAQVETSAFADPISLERLVRFAGSSGDFNPLHYDLEAARAAGFDRPVVVGSMTTALLVTELLAVSDLAGLRRIEVRFKAPTLVGARLNAVFEDPVDVPEGSATIGAKVTEADEVVVDGQVTLGGFTDELEQLPEDFVALGPAYRWPVEEGAARYFAQAVGDVRPMEPGSVVHPTFVSTAMRWSPSPRDFVERLDFDFSRMVHGSTVLQYAEAPIRIGETLWVTEGHSGRRSVEGRQGLMNLADAHLVVRDESGSIRAHLTYRIVERAKP